MYQVIEMTDKEKYEMYNSLEKDVLIGMLIECNKHLQNRKPTIKLPENQCTHYQAGTDTSSRCIYCGKTMWEHNIQYYNNY